MNSSRIYYRKLLGSIAIALIFTSIFVSLLVIRPALGSDWWNDNWLYRKKITINHVKVAGNLTNFPVLVDTTDSDLASKAQDNGYDIVFTDNNKTKLNHEVELFNGTSGKLVAWVKIPSLSSTTDTILYMYYGNATVPNQANPVAVWTSNYRMVQHLEETSGTQYDSTSYGNNGTYSGTQQGISGKIDGADGFVETTGAGGNYVDCGNAASVNINDAITVSAWIKPNNQAGYEHLCTKGADLATTGRAYQMSISATEVPDFIINGVSPGAQALSSVAVTIGSWSYVVGTYDKSYVRIYVNGVDRGNKSYTAAIFTKNVNLRIAARVSGLGPSGPAYATFGGTMDEVRVSNVSRTATWISTEYNNQNDPNTFYSIGVEETSAPPPPPPPWWNTSWQYRKKLTIAHSLVSTKLTDFPVLVTSTDSDLASKAQDDGDDIAFTDINKTKLSHEIEFFNGTSGQLVAWVKVPSLSSTADTILYMYYDNPASSSQADPTAVWTSNYRMVQHLEETSGTQYDSTSYGNNGTYYGTKEGIDGKIDGADGFVGNLAAAGGDYVDCGNATSLNINNAITVSAWIKPTDQTQWNHLCTKGCDIPNRVYQLSIEANEQIDFIINANTTNGKATTTASVPIGAWSYVVGTYDKTNVKVYINGSEGASVPFTQAINTNSVNLRIAGRIYGTGNSGPSAYTFDGTMDEVHVVAVARSQAWIQTEYNNQNNPSTFYTIGTEEKAPLTIQYVPPTPDDNATISTGTVTINVTSNANLSSATLIWWQNPPIDFKISINETLQTQWGFKYPATYVFSIPDGSSNIDVFRRDSTSESWTKLPEKTSNDFFNGIECARFDYINDKVYVSVGFNTTSNIYLRFANVSSVTFNSIAKYYDNRKATYTLSNDNWGKVSSAHPGATWQGMTNDASDSYQASIHACRLFNIPESIAINTAMAGGASMWQRMQEELNYGDYSWEPAIHTRTHPGSSSGYLANGYEWEIIGCKNDILGNLTNIPYGNYIFEFILPNGYEDNTLQSTSAGKFLFLRDWTGSSNPSSVNYAPWNTAYQYYGIGGLETKSYDSVLQSLSPAGTYSQSAVNELNNAFYNVYSVDGIFYAMFHSDRYDNSVIYNNSPNSSTLMEHFRYVANRKDVWYVANGWLYSYHMVAERASVTQESSSTEYYPMNIHNADEHTFAYYTKTDLVPGETYHYQVQCNDTLGGSVATLERKFTVSSDVDLTVTGISILNHGCSIYNNDTYANGTNYNYPVEVTVRNNGTQESESFYVRLEVYWINGSLSEGYNEIQVSNLAAKTSMIVNFTSLFRPTHVGS